MSENEIKSEGIEKASVGSSPTPRTNPNLIVFWGSTRFRPLFRLHGDPADSRLYCTAYCTP